MTFALFSDFSSSTTKLGTYPPFDMKAFLVLILASLVFAAPLRSQTPTPKPTADYVVTAGDFPHPGLVPYTSGMTFLQAIEAAGSIVEFANVKAIYIIRCGKKEKVNLKMLRNDPTQDLVLQPWDIVYLPQPIL